MASGWCSRRRIAAKTTYISAVRAVEPCAPNDSIGYIATGNGKDLVLSVRSDGAGKKAWSEPLPETIGQVWWLSNDKVLITKGDRRFVTLENGKETVFRTPNGPNEAFRIHGFSRDNTTAITALMPLSRRVENPLYIFDVASGK